MQRTKINLPYSPWEEILFGVPERSILGPLLFKIFLMWPIFHYERNFASYTVDNTPYKTTNTVDEVIQSLERDNESKMKSNMNFLECISERFYHKFK